MDDMEVLNQAEQIPGDELEQVEEQVGTPEEVYPEIVIPDRLFLTTPFEDYTVTEGLLLMLLLLAVVMVCVKLLKGGFSWL